MKRIISTLCLLLACVLGSGTFNAMAQDDIGEHRDCIRCGMDRKAYGYSRMVVVYEDGGRAGVCSLHCAVTEMDSNKGRKVRTLLAADRDTRSLVDAEKAVWVLGGRKRGVMTQRAKWAFTTAAAAKAFVGSNGGAIISWPEALSAAREDAAPKPR